VRLGTEEEITWWLHGTRTFFPENWRRFVSSIPEEERGDLLAAYHRRLMDPAPAVHLPAAVACLRHVPGYIMQGRYDMICPPRYADRLARAWPGARFEIVPDAGHSAFERSTVTRLIAATEACKRLS
jgi:proline iminopeptidase